jgi:tRNA-2-methylthio-N6-dimethylallyladenosine synthase
MAPMKKIYVKTYGCQMNVYDSGKIADLLGPFGYQTCQEPEQADLIVLNTCHIREKAEEKVFSDLGRYRRLKVARKDSQEELILVVAGCVAQAEGALVLKRAPYVDAVVGPQTYHQLPEVIGRILRRKKDRAGPGYGILATGFPKDSKFDYLPEESLTSGATAFLSIQEGCDKFCRYCVVPFTRGAEYSRSVEEILQEARTLVQGGSREIILLGQNVNAYHGLCKLSSQKDQLSQESNCFVEGEDVKNVLPFPIDSLLHTDVILPKDSGKNIGRGKRSVPLGYEVWGLGRLIRALDEIPGLERIRYMTSHPRDMDEDLIQTHANIFSLMPFLHLPVQSGSNRILEKMNRKYTVELYKNIIQELRFLRPGIGFSSDFIVGYPDETDEDFQATCQLVEDIVFYQAYSFRYSPRPGTPAASMVQVPEDIQNKRLQYLQSILRQQQQDFNHSCIGKKVVVLVERKGRKENQWTGKTPHMQATTFITTENVLGKMVEVEIQGAHAFSLQGSLCNILS